MIADILAIVDGTGKRRVIGEVINQTLHMKREKSKHFFRKNRSWAMDYNAFHNNPDIKIFIITDTENNMRYIASRQKFLEFGEKIVYNEHLPQISLPIKHWALHQI